MELLLFFGLGLQGFYVEVQLAGVLLMLHKDTQKQRDERNFLAAVATAILCKVRRMEGRAFMLNCGDKTKSHTF